MASLANIAAQQTAGAARETFGREHAASLSKEAAAFDPFGTKATRAEREKASLSMQEEQLKHAQLSRKLKEDAAAAQKDLQKLQMSKFNPEMVADVYSASNALDGEYQFDKRHFNETGKIKLRKGKFSRNDMGERDMHDDGTFIFSPTDEKYDIEFENKQDMIDHVQGSIFDPKVRMAALLNKDEFEFFKKKKATERKESEKLAEKKHEHKMAEGKQTGEYGIQKAKIYAGAMGKKGKGKQLTPKQAADLKMKQIDDLRKSITEDINEFKGEELKHRFTRPEVEKIMPFVQADDFADAMVQGMRDEKTANGIIKILKDAKLPADFVEYIEAQFEEAHPEEEKKSPGFWKKYFNIGE